MRQRALFVAIATWLAACSSPPTQLLVVTDTDLAVPGAVDAIHIDVTGTDGVMHSSDAVVTAGSLPLTTRLIHESGPLGPVVVRAVARKSGGDVVDRTVRVDFVEGHLRVLRIDLAGACIGRSCAMDETCGSTGDCRPQLVSPAELEEWNGVVPPHGDGGTTDMPACVATTEVCNGRDDDCNGQIDETTNLRMDVHHCGGCTNDCGTVPNGTPVCVLGACDVVCDATHADCDGEFSNGCERSIASPTDCGACDADCMIAHATPGCAMATCTIASCLPGWDTCDRVAGLPDLNGCETNVSTDPERCGSCIHACPTPPHASPICADGTCDFACDSGWADCGGSPGCESSLAVPATCGDCLTRCMGATPLCSGDMLNGYSCTDACMPPTMQCGMSCVDTSQSTQNCGGCSMPCPSLDHASPTCVASTCGFGCDPFYGDCDGTASTGCEQSLRDVATCGSCTTPCAPPHATGVCGDATCAIGSCDTGFADCNGMVGDGCEVQVTTDVLHCGSCPTACPAAPMHAVPTCDATSGCGIACDAGWADCNGMASDGCETDVRTTTDCGSCGIACAPGMLCQTDASGAASCVAGCGGAGDPHMICTGSCVDTSSDPGNCMGCGNVCASATHASPSCGAAGCTFSCAPGFDDCDGMTSTGCETDLASTATHCGSCPNSCAGAANATPTCSAGACGVVCNTSYADCSATAPGCETMLGTTMNCTRCGEMCMGGAHVSANTCTAAGCVITCRSGYWNCDGVPTNGCEVHAASASSMCMACGTTPCP